MKTFLPLITLFAAFWFTGCAASAKRDTPVVPTNKAFYPRVAGKDQHVQQDIEKFAAEAKGKVGVGAVDLETGEYFSLDSEGHFPMQSVYKLPISLAVIKQYENQHLDLDQKIKVTKEDFVRRGLRSPIRDRFPEGTELSVRELIQYALEESDGTASDVLLRIAGGGQRVQEYLATLGITDMKVVDSEADMYLDWQNQYANWSTPAAAVDLLQALYEGRALATETGRLMVLQMMTNSSPGPKRIRGLLEETPVAHKTGTSGTKDGINAATNDIGIVSLKNGKHFAIAVFVSDSTADEHTREAAIAKITKVLFNYWYHRPEKVGQ
jgi:beta-lactamase class A